MATVKVGFRPSIVAGKEGTIFYKITHKRVVKQVKTIYHILPSEWNKEAERIELGNARHERSLLLSNYQNHIDQDVKWIKRIIWQLDTKQPTYTAYDVATAFKLNKNNTSLFLLIRKMIKQFNNIGKYRTAETYHTTLRSFYTFRNGLDIWLEDIDSELIQQYEAHLRKRGVVKNTSSFYMRILRAVYNHAVEKGLTEHSHPFRHVYTGIDKTRKRAIPLKMIRKIKGLDLSLAPSLDFARDMFLFSFYTRGMSLIDMAYLRKKDLRNNVLTYRRRKTGQQLSIKWESCMQDICNKYPKNSAGYLLPIIREKGSAMNERRQYNNALHLINMKLKEISRMLGLDLNLTTYVSRHSWASAAKSNNVPLSVISESMGHDSETTTQIYLAALDSSAIDKANETILSHL